MAEIFKENRFFKTNQQLLSLMPKILANFEVKKEGNLTNFDILMGKCDLIMFDHVSNDLILIKRENDSVVTLYTIKVFNSTMNCSQLLSQELAIVNKTVANNHVSLLIRTKCNNFGTEIEQQYAFCCSKGIKYKESFITNSLEYETLLDSIKTRQQKLNEETGLCIRRTA